MDCADATQRERLREIDLALQADVAMLQTHALSREDQVDVWMHIDLMLDERLYVMRGPPPHPRFEQP